MIPTRGRAGSWASGGVAVAVIAAFSGCADDRPEAIARGDLDSPPCPMTAVESFPKDVRVSDTEPICRLGFRVVTELVGEMDGYAPRPPIAISPSGEFVTQTYQPGLLAVWAADGGFERVIGRGPGSGPGEFSLAGTIRVNDGVVTVYDLERRLLRYGLGGDFIDSARLPMTGRATLLSDGGVVMSTRGIETLMLVRGGESSSLGLPRTLPSRSSIVVSHGDRLWEAEYYRYSIREVASDGDGFITIRREAPWFIEPSSESLNGSTVQQFTFDSLGTVWVRTHTLDVDGRPRPDMEAGQPVNIEPEEWRYYFDGRIEAISMDGKLIASELFDNPFDAPIPITSARWYLHDEDDLSVTILEPVLFER